jgi:hypothetical protein
LQRKGDGAVRREFGDGEMERQINKEMDRFCREREMAQ